MSTKPSRSTKAQTISAIEASATEVFCREGYDRASLREIASGAGVSLSSIHEYFGSKTGLYISIGRRIFERFETQRRQLLTEATKGGKKPELDQLVYCLVAPNVLPEFIEERDSTWGPLQIRTWYETVSYLEFDPRLKQSLRDSVEDWVTRLSECCAGLTYDRARFAYGLVASTMCSWAGPTPTWAIRSVSPVV